MVNEINVSQRYGAAGAVKASGTPAAEKPAKEESQQEQAAKASKVDTVNLGTRQEESVTYANVTSKKLSASDIESLKAQADAATENLRKLVEELILKQNKNYKPLKKLRSRIWCKTPSSVPMISKRQSRPSRRMASME